MDIEPHPSAAEATEDVIPVTPGSSDDEDMSGVITADLRYIKRTTLLTEEYAVQNQTVWNDLCSRMGGNPQASHRMPVDASGDSLHVCLAGRGQQRNASDLQQLTIYNIPCPIRESLSPRQLDLLENAPNGLWHYSMVTSSDLREAQTLADLQAFHLETRNQAAEKYHVTFAEVVPCAENVQGRCGTRQFKAIFYRIIF